MQAVAAWALTGTVLAACVSVGEAQPFITCHVENGPSPELTMHHQFTPHDLLSLSVKIVETHGMCRFNITWILNADASIRYLNATKICVSPASASRACVRCDYSEEFESQTRPDGQNWQFYYVGFSVQEITKYFIEASNIPPANILEDMPKKEIILTSPGCQDSMLKHCNTCIEMGSLWDPEISACYTESEVEVNFTASGFSPNYFIFLCESDDCIDHTVSNKKKNDTRVSVRIPLNDKSRKTLIELIPYFPKCRNDCVRYSDYMEMCPEESVSDPDVTNLLGTYLYALAALLLVVCVLAAILYLKRRHDTAKSQGFLYPAMKQIPTTTVLIVYSPEVCFQHTVLGFADFLHERCHSEVIIDAWQKRRIVEIGPVQWFATQREIAEKIIFLTPGPRSAACDAACERTIESHKKDSECMFTLAFNLFCSDLKNQSSPHKYMVVSFNETNLAEQLPSPLNSCPKYFLMKDIGSFCRDLCFSRNLGSGEGRKSKCSGRFKINLKPLV
ncbi:hypothetical protein JRQ81_003010 [Phrynocephalus forsythii]|uniref:SEFIR domain-containing protein n=1 Tax=Phrynocephalus forsythii TaxID=171643 RepID=A0A9Q0XJ12_9SAUR|nr:hypothetical protein JRQ81_003010 [Phrynocephalus forsythii]